MPAARPTRAQLLMAYATMAKVNTNTGKKNSKGRTVYQGPKGGLFVRTKKGKKMYKIF